MIIKKSNEVSRKKVFFVLEVLICRSEGGAEVQDIEEFDSFVRTTEPEKVDPCNGKHLTTLSKFCLFDINRDLKNNIK